ncbi:YihY/virulence factor BrkB family protein [soil metagenome]
MKKPSFKGIWSLLKNSGSEFIENNSFRLAGALAYVTIFSLPPLLIVMINFAGAIWGEEAVTGRLFQQIRSVVGDDAAAEIQTMIANFNQHDAGAMAAVIGIGTLIFASTTFFATLQESLNAIWNIRVKPESSIMYMIKVRATSFGLILSLGLLMLISFVLSAALLILTDYLQSILPGVALIFIYIFNLLLNLFVISMLFALVYRFLPDAHIRWKDTLVGAFVTALLFILGKYGIGLYIGNSDINSAYGAAGSLIVILVWIYWSSLILFYGAEFTQEYAEMYGHGVKPKKHAVRFALTEVHEPRPHVEGAGRPPADGRFRKK